MNLEAGVPIPAQPFKRPGAQKYPFYEMQVGDRFKVPEGKHKRVRSCICMRHIKMPERFMVRMDGGEWYCWRTA